MIHQRPKAARVVRGSVIQEDRKKICACLMLIFSFFCARYVDVDMVLCPARPSPFAAFAAKRRHAACAKRCAFDSSRPPRHAARQPRSTILIDFAFRRRRATQTQTDHAIRSNARRDYTPLTASLLSRRGDAAAETNSSSISFIATEVILASGYPGLNAERAQLSPLRELAFPPTCPARRHDRSPTPLRPRHVSHVIVQRAPLAIARAITFVCRRRNIPDSAHASRIYRIQQGPSSPSRLPRHGRGLARLEFTVDARHGRRRQVGQVQTPPTSVTPTMLRMRNNIVPEEEHILYTEGNVT